MYVFCLSLNKKRNHGFLQSSPKVLFSKQKFSSKIFDFGRQGAAWRQKSKNLRSLHQALVFDFWRRGAARRQKSKKIPSCMAIFFRKIKFLLLYYRAYVLGSAVIILWGRCHLIFLSYLVVAKFSVYAIFEGFFGVGIRN